MKNNIIFLLLVWSTSILNLQAQDIKTEHRANKQALRAEMKAYLDAEVKPVVNQQREKLNTYLSRREKKEVEAIRTELKDLSIRSREFRKNVRESSKGPNSLTEEQKRTSRGFAKEKRALNTRAWAIVDAHEEEIATLIEELEPHMDTWRTEMRTLMQKNMPERKGNREDRIKGSSRKGTDMRGHMGKGRGGRGFGPGRGTRGMNWRQIKSPVGFLLWDNNNDFAQEDPPSLSVFPNPTAASNTLKFTLTESGPITVNILNDRGILIKTLLQESREAGTYTEKFDLSELEKGLYLYQIKTSAGINTQKLIIEK